MSFIPFPARDASVRELPGVRKADDLLQKTSNNRDIHDRLPHPDPPIPVRPERSEAKSKDALFRQDLNGAQAVVASLLLRHAENRRKRPPQDAPDFLAYGSRFIAMLMGRYLLEEMGIPLDRLDHRNFTQARDLVEQRSDSYVSRAEQRIEDALRPLFSTRERTLQRLPATFRRADLIDSLLKDCEGSSP